MKKILISLLALMLLLCLPVAAQGQEQTHSHCVCGGAAVGVGDHTQCENVTWMPISEAFAAVGCSMEKANFGKLPDGYYYLDGDVIVTASGAIGAQKTVTVDGKTEVDKLATEPAVVKHIAICLNGHSIIASGKEKDGQDIKPFGYLHMDSSLTICDCSFDGQNFAGSVTGGVRNYGSVIYTRSRSTLNIYGGNFQGYSKLGGGAIVIACDDCGDLDGDGTYSSSKDTLKSVPAVLNLYNGHIEGAAVSGEGGTIKMFHTAGMNMYGGTVVGGSATKGGAISASTGTVYLYGGTVIGGEASEAGGALHASKYYILGATVTGGTVAGQAEVCQVLNAQGKLLSTYTDLSAAFTAVKGKTDRYVRMIRDTETDVTVDGTVYLDLCGRTLSGLHIAGNLYCMDSTTDSYDGTRAGKLIPASGAPVREHKTTEARVGGIRRYLGLEEDGVWSFHRFYMGITNLTLKTGDVGFGYKAYFAGSDVVKEALSNYGFHLWIPGGQPVTRALSGDRLNAGQELSLRLTNFLDTKLTDAQNNERAKLPVSATVFLTLKDGTVVETAPVSYTFRQMVEMVNESYPGLPLPQRRAIQGLSGNYSRIMMGWDISNTHHITNSIWAGKGKNNTTFQKLLTQKSGNDHYIAAGTYYLTEDVNLGNKTIWVKKDTEVKICLNGFNLNSDGRMFKVYGHLTLCDCHAGEANEGDVISALSGEEKTYAPIFYAYAGGEVDLYGGNLKATGTGVTTAGVCAVSHDGDADSPSAVFNIHGGTISGGKSLSDGGLIWVIHESTLNMYGGKLYGGQAAGKGGAIHANTGCTVNLLGGTITGNTANFGGAVRVEGANLKIAGTMVVEDNTASSRGDNVYPDMASELDLEDLQEGARVYMSSDAYRVLGNSQDIAKYVLCDDSAQAIRNHYGRMTMVDDSMQVLSNPAGFTAGFGQVCIDPDVIEGVPLSGYGTADVRLATTEGRKTYDKLYAQVVAVTDDRGETVILISCDVIRPSGSFTPSIVNAIHAATNVPKGNIFVNCSHSHSVPEINQISNPMIIEYNADLPNWFAQAAYAALADRTPATMETGSFDVMTDDGKRMNFMRHYSYTDANGVVQYFGDHFHTDGSDPDVTSVYNSTTKHIWEADPTMYLVRFVRDGKDILMANWRAHPHMTGGAYATKMSADIIGTLRYYMNRKLPDTHFMYIQGAAGNVNENSRLNADQNNKYGSPIMHHGLNYVQYGETLAGLIVKNLGCLEDKPTGDVQVDNYSYTAYYDLGNEEAYKKAKEVKDAINADATLDTVQKKAKRAREYGYDSYYELGFITRLYEQRENGSQSTQLAVNTFSIGSSLGFFTAPGEMWDTVSIKVEKSVPFDTTICVGYSQEHYNYMIYYPEEYLEEYFPAGTTLTNGAPYKSYESQNRRYLAPQTIEGMIDYWITSLTELYGNAATAETELTE